MPRLADWSVTSLLLLAPLTGAAAQGVPLERPPRVGTESVTVAADSSHAAGPLHRFFFGSGYRDLWVTPITVPVLDLERFDGGLTATESGGGMQTKSLRLENDEGFEWTFRSVAKDARSILPEKLRNSFMVGIVNDQISHAHPGGALVVPPLASAIGILHAQPQLAVMPDVPALGEFRETYGGMLGIIEEFMDDLPDGEAGFAGSDDIVNSEDLLEELRQDPSVRIDAHDFLKARLLDLVINDWDRHRDQWRWAKLERRGGEYWVPIPRDRDNALFWFDGFFPSIARMVAPKLLPFGSRISLKGLTVSSRDLDPVILAPLDRREWDSLATFVMERLTDSLIMAAEAGIPPEYRPEHEELVAGRLISRRNGLRTVALRFYDQLAEVVVVHATDAPERGEIEYTADGSVTVEIFDAREDAEDDAPYFSRRFLPDETKEVRIYLHGGDDVATLRGEGRSRVRVRLIGGLGRNDVEGDLRALARLYDFDGPPTDLTYGPDTLFDRRPWHVEGDDTLPPRPDRGGNAAPIIDLRYYTGLGLVSSIGMDMHRYGFRTWPYARRTSFELQHAGAPSDTRFRVEADFRREGGGIHPTFRAMASGLELARWYGPGNETVRPPDGEGTRIEHGHYGAELVAAADIAGGTFELGPTVQFTRTSPDQTAFGGSPPYGTGDFGLAGGHASWTLDTRNAAGDMPKGIRLRLDGRAFPALWDAEEGFGSLGASAVSYISVPVTFSPVLALKAGGRKVFGTFPFFESAFVGGVHTVRGFDENRFAGDAAAWGGAELRLSLFPVNILLPFNFGVHGLADAGRVWADGEDSDEWHSAFGGGFSLGLDQPTGLLSVTLADGGEMTAVYIELGFNF